MVLCLSILFVMGTFKGAFADKNIQFYVYTLTASGEIPIHDAEVNLQGYFIRLPTPSGEVTGWDSIGRQRTDSAGKAQIFLHSSPYMIKAAFNIYAYASGLEPIVMKPLTSSDVIVRMLPRLW